MGDARWINAVKYGFRHCITCGDREPWPCTASQKNARQWNSNPGLIRPFEQYVAESFPRSSDGFARADIDHVFRIFDPAKRGDLGVAFVAGSKSFGKKLNFQEEQMLKLLQQPELVMGYGQFILHNGNTPGPVTHYPTQFYGLPEQPKVAERIEWVSVEREGDGFAIHRTTVESSTFVDFVISRLTVQQQAAE